MITKINYWFYWLLTGALTLLALSLWLYSTQNSQKTWEPNYQAGIVAYQQGNYDEAVRSTKAALKAAKSFGRDDPRLANTLYNLAVLYDAQGKYAEAEPLYNRSLAIKKKDLGPEFPQAALNLDNLADLYQDQGKYHEAEQLYKRALAIDEKVLGPQHPELIVDLNDLAALYHVQGKYADAVPLNKRSLEHIRFRRNILH